MNVVEQTLEERARAYLVKHDCPPGHRAIAAVMEAMADERERAAKVMDDRVALYLAKAERRDPFADDSMNAWEGSKLCAEASEWGAEAIRRLEREPQVTLMGDTSSKPWREGADQ